MEEELTETGTFEQLAHLPKSARIAGRYEILEKLGSGGMSSVYLAHDVKNDCEIAIKFMKTDLGGSARRRFFREFNTIAGIQHPCCLQVFEIGENQNTPYFTMELHPGRPVTSILGDAPEVVAPALVDLTLAVDYIHSQGVVHRDIKPSNVLVQQIGDADGRRLTCKLADFGLAKFYQLDSSLTEERGLVGTPAYCAPEQIEVSEIDHRVDLYAVGLLAFELLSGGRHPFSEARNQGMHALLHAQLAVQPPKLAAINPNLPASLCEVVDSYLAKEPDLRPNSALPLRRALCEEFGIEVDSRLAQLSSPSEVVLNAVGFVCREPELKRVDSFLQQRVSAGDAASSVGESRAEPLLLFTGDPGTGKTSTMQEAVRRAIGQGYQVFEGRCLDGGNASFQPMIEILRQILSSIARTQRSVDESTLLAEYQTAQSDLERMQEILMDYHAELLLIAPELRRWLGGESQTPSLYNDPEYLFRAFATMFTELSQVTPLCLCFDDIQWADNSTSTFLRHLVAAVGRIGPEHARQRDFGGLPIVIFCTGRSGYPSLESFRSRLESQSRFVEIELKPLSQHETRELLALRLGSLPSSITTELVESLQKLCQGNPYFLSETIREWHQRGMIVRTSDGWQRVHESLDEESSLPSTVRSALRNRIADLSAAAKTLVPAAAVIGRVVDLDLLFDVVEEVAESELLDAVDELLSKRVFVEGNTASRVAFAHDLLRETVQADLSANRRRSLHRRVAQVLETGNHNVAEGRLAQHYIEGELTSKAFEYLLLASTTASEKYAFEDGLRYVELAEQNEPEQVGRDKLFRLYRIKTLCLLNLGDSKTKEAGDKALTYAVSPEELAQVHLLLGRFGGVASASFSRLRNFGHENFDTALAALGMPRPKSKLAQLLSIQFNLFAFHFFPSPILALVNRAKTMESRYRIGGEILYEFAHSVAVNDVLAYTQICTTNIRIARTSQSSAAKAVAFAKYGLNLAFSGLNARFGFAMNSFGVYYGRKGLKAAEESGRADILAAVRTSLGFSVFCNGQLAEAEQILLDAEKTLSRACDLHTCYCYHYLRHVYSMTGEVEKILAAGHQELENALMSDNQELQAWSHYGLTHGYALKGDFEKAMDSADTSIRLTTQNESNFGVVSRMEKGFAQLQNSQYDLALETLLEAQQMMRSKFFYFEIGMLTFPRIVEAALGPDWHRGASAKHCDFKSARQGARQAKFFRMSFPNIRPQTSRVLGRLNFARGKTTAAKKCFEKAVAESSRIGARYEHARTLIDMGIAFSELESLREQGLAELEQIGAVMPAAELAAATN